MAQTKVNDYFVNRKASFPIHPSKKRKVDASDIDLNTTNKKKSNHQATRVTRNKRKQLKQASEKQNVVPLSFDEAKPAKLPGTPEKTLDAINNIIKTSPMGKVKIDESINDQAKTILHSRGTAILKASLREKTATSPAKASEVLLSMSPKKYLETTTTTSDGELVITVNNVNDTSQSSSLQKRKEQLRKKYSKLLKDEEPTLADSKPNVKVDNSSNAVKNEGRNRLKNKYKHLLNKESTVKVNEPVTSSTQNSEKIISSPQKAFEKYQHLTEKNVTTTFQLPQKYKLLLEMFRCADSVLYLLQQRSEICTFDRLKKSVQSMCGRDFDAKNLAAMKTVYSNGFVFRQEKGLYCSNGDGKSKSYQLSIEANYKDLQLSKASIKNNSSILITRRLKFENRLLEITKAHHQKFLRKLNLKIEDNQIHRWHPHFKLEEIPDVELSLLPNQPVTKSFSSAADLLHRNQNLSTKVANALQKASSQGDSGSPNSTNKDKTNIESSNSTPATTTTPSTSSSSSSSTKNTNVKLKGVSSDLLERIRLKEQKKLELAMTRNPKQELRLSRMERLPEITRIVKSFFVAEKKAAITLEDCVQKLSESYGTDLHTSNLEEHVRLLAEVVPKWLQIIPVRKCLYVKLAKNFDINNVINTLADVRKKEEEKA